MTDLLTIKFCTFQDSIIVLVCAKFHYDLTESLEYINKHTSFEFEMQSKFDYLDGCQIMTNICTCHNNTIVLTSVKDMVMTLLVIVSDQNDISMGFDLQLKNHKSNMFWRLMST